VAASLSLRLPGIAAIRINPSQSVAELQDAVDDAAAALDKLRKNYGVANLVDAVNANQRLIAARADVDNLKQRQAEIRNGETDDEIRRALNRLQTECSAYDKDRQAAGAVPMDAAAAAERTADTSQKLAELEAAFETSRERAESLQAQFNEQDGRFRLTQQEVAGLEAALEDKRASLERHREELADAALEDRVRKTSADADKLRTAMANLQGRLDAQSPESVEELLNNSRAVLERAVEDGQKAERELAVLDGRLQSAQADGRFESMEAAERTFEQRAAELAATQRRRVAAKRLWDTLNRHRNEARQVYVRPLKDAIERLGRIVFKGTLEVEIGDDWSLISRTLDGQTILFDDLSVGTREQLSILTRLAAAQIVSSHGGVPLIIDDALGFSDPSRLETMGAAIAAAAKHCQIIILTCTPGRFTHIGKAGVVRF
jgi:chromosome segregation ATPase